MKNLKALLQSNEEWLIERILAYAIKFGYAAYTSTLKEAWRLSISGMTASIIEGINRYEKVPEIGPEENFVEDPVVIFGIVEAQRHRERGVSLSMFLGLIKYYRQVYIDFIKESYVDIEEKELAESFINRIFDRVEIGFCVEWAGSDSNKAVQDLQISNRLMTNEKNKYLTIFESIPNPVIILNRSRKIDNMNISAAKLFKKSLSPGSQYYCQTRDRQLEFEQYISGDEASIEPTCFGGQNLYELFPWLKTEVENFHNKSLKSFVFEKKIKYEEQEIIYRVKLSKSLDVSGKFDGTIIILEDITSLKNALAEVKTLKGLLPICSHCKNIRNDEGFWQRVENYIGEHSEASFSHSICPECLKKYYPEYDVSPFSK